jgi:hypothetical protein
MTNAASTQTGVGRWVEMTPKLLLDMCRAFEKRYEMTSPEFYERHLHGEFVGQHFAYRWAGYWESYLDKKRS